VDELVSDQQLQPLDLGQRRAQDQLQRCRVVGQVCGRETVRKVGVGQAARRNGPQRSATAWSRSSVPFTTEVQTFSIKWAPRGDQRICCWAFIRRCSSHLTVLSVIAVAAAARKVTRLLRDLETYVSGQSNIFCYPVTRRRP
jgi:hypothetical protein